MAVPDDSSVAGMTGLEHYPEKCAVCGAPAPYKYGAGWLCKTHADAAAMSLLFRPPPTHGLLHSVRRFRGLSP